MVGPADNGHNSEQRFRVVGVRRRWRVHGRRGAPECFAPDRYGEPELCAKPERVAARDAAGSFVGAPSYCFLLPQPPHYPIRLTACLCYPQPRPVIIFLCQATVATNFPLHSPGAGLACYQICEQTVNPLPIVGGQRRLARPKFAPRRSSNSSHMPTASRHSILRSRRPVL